MRLLLTIAIIITLSVLYSAEIKNGQLFLEIYVLDGKQITVTPQGDYTISEIGSPVSRSYKDKVTLQLVAADEQAMWGFINRTEVIEPDSLQYYTDENIREKFVWQDSLLTIRHERLTFEDKYFPTQEAAQKYASETGYTKKQIRSIPMQNAGLKVTLANGENHFYQLPVKLTCVNGVSFNDNSDIYQGMFIIKPLHALLSITNLQDIENYVAGVVPNEIGDNGPIEALKVQAIAARSHAISLLLYNRHADDGYDLCNGTHCQVYKGNHLRTAAVDRAILETKGIIMMYDHKVADGVYSSNCGGKTEGNQYAWAGAAIPYLQGVACYPELDSLDFTHEHDAIQWINTKNTTPGMASWEKRSETWERSLNKSTLEANSGISNLTSLTVLRRGVSGRIVKLKLSGDSSKVIDSEWKIRQMFGSLPSSYFYISNSKNDGDNTYHLSETIAIKGKGFGHGVGLCQVGTLQKARADWKWEDILRLYFPGVTFSQNWLAKQNPNFLTNGME